jgi:hypothetical protein
MKEGYMISRLSQAGGLQAWPYKLRCTTYTIPYSGPHFLARLVVGIVSFILIVICFFNNTEELKSKWPELSHFAVAIIS